MPRTHTSTVSTISTFSISAVSAAAAASAAPNDPDESKQASKALKCVAFTNMQVGDMMYRKYDRLEHRIRSISEEIDLLKADLTENLAHQRERRQQLSDIEEDVEKARVLGNAVLVEELLEELQVLKEEGKREEKLFQAIRKVMHSRKAVKLEFIEEKAMVEEELRQFNLKQQLIQSLLSTCTEKSSVNSQSSSASQSDCGADEEGDHVSPMLKAPRFPTRASDLDAEDADLPPVTRSRRWSSACSLTPQDTRMPMGRSRSSSACATVPLARITEGRARSRSTDRAAAPAS